MTKLDQMESRSTHDISYILANPFVQTKEQHQLIAMGHQRERVREPEPEPEELHAAAIEEMVAMDEEALARNVPDLQYQKKKSNLVLVLAEVEQQPQQEQRMNQTGSLLTRHPMRPGVGSV